jgi:hypothetical protein
MPSYTPPQGARKKDYGVYPPQGVKVKPVAPPAPPPPEFYINILDSAIGSELIDIFKVMFGVEQNLLVAELSTQSFIPEYAIIAMEVNTQSFIPENVIVVAEVVFPA